MTTPMPPADGAPVFLTGSVTLDLTAPSGQTITLNSQKISGNYETPIIIEEFRFWVIPSPLYMRQYAHATGDTIGKNYDFGSILTFNVSVNLQNLTQTSIHLRSLAQLVQTRLSYGSQQSIDAGSLQGYTYNSTFFRCVLPDPLYVDPLAAISAAIGVDAPGLRPIDPQTEYPTIQVWFAAVGRTTTSTRPKYLPFPYFAEFAPAMAAPVGGIASFAASQNTIFRNPFYQPIRVKKFVASLYVNFPTNVAILPNFAWQTDSLYRAPGAVTVSMKDSHGSQISPPNANIPLGLLVDGRSGDWTFERNLGPGEWYDLQLFGNGLPSLPVGATGQPTLFPRVALLGTRMVEAQS